MSKPAQLAAKRTLAEIVKSLAKLKTRIAQDTEEWEEKREKAATIMSGLDVKCYTLPNVGKIEIAPNKPRLALDKELLKTHLVEVCGLAPSQVVEAFEASMKEGKVSKPFRVDFDLLGE